jgi:hypothetical protein
MWQDIHGLPGWQASEQGEIKNPRGKIIRQQVGARGFLKVNIGTSTRLVHKLILLAFYGPSKEKPTFRNGNKQDCRLANLCYGEKSHAKVGAKCSKGHDLVGENVATWGSNRICRACQEGRPAVRELPEIL